MNSFPLVMMRDALFDAKSCELLNPFRLPRLEILNMWS